MELYAIKYGETTLPESLVFEGGNKEVVLPISFTIFLIKLGARLILVDAGCDDMPGFDMRHFVSPAEILGRMGIQPQEITDLLLTHAHHDHFAAVGHFENADIYVNSAEYTEELKFRIPQSARVILCHEETDIAENIVFRHIGGHSVGSSVVELTVGDKIHVLSGDECYSPLCIERKIPTGASCNPEKSQGFIEHYSQPQYILHICHDPAYLPHTNGYLKIL